ncbi:hypothetical protein ACFLXK_04025 [Chloroflexota bacterium]
MRIGPLEIIAIVIIIVAIVVIARIARIKPDDTAQSRESSTGTDITSRRAKDGPGRIQNYLKRLGITFFIAGTVFALAGISMFKWAVQGYVWAFVAMVLGTVLLFLSRKK